LARGGILALLAGGLLWRVQTAAGGLSRGALAVKSVAVINGDPVPHPEHGGMAIIMVTLNLDYAGHAQPGSSGSSMARLSNNIDKEVMET
jgi:hypothetical protein